MRFSTILKGKNDYTYLKNHKQILLDTWLLSPPSGYRHLSHHELCQVYSTLVDAFITDLHAQQGPHYRLIDWAERQQQLYQVCLSDLYEIIMQLRHTITTLYQNSACYIPIKSDTQLNKAMIKMIKIFDRYAQKILENRVQEIEDMIRDEKLIQQSGCNTVSLHPTPLSAAKVMQKLLATLVQTTKAQSSALWTVRQDTVQVTMSEGFAPNHTSNIFCLQINAYSIVAAAVRCQQTFVLDSSVTAKSDLDHQLLNALKVSTLLAIPFLIQQKTTGIITLHSNNEQMVQQLDRARQTVQQTAVTLQHQPLTLPT